VEGLCEESGGKEIEDLGLSVPPHMSGYLLRISISMCVSVLYLIISSSVPFPSGYGPMSLEQCLPTSPFMVLYA
jgi:hypothetical protein